MPITQRQCFLQFFNIQKSQIQKMKSQLSSNFQKKIKDYVISYCPTQYYGKNIHGQLRAGYKAKQNKIVVFRIVPLPLTPALTIFLQLQHHYSGLGGFARNVQEPLHSSSNHYVPLQYFPKTFNSQKNLFKSNPKYFDEYIQKFLRIYAFFYNMRVTHGNLTANNIGITFQGKVKLMDFGVQHQNQTFEQRSRHDFKQFKHVIGVILQKDDHFPAKFASFNLQQTSNWEHLFSLWHVTSPLQPLYLPRKGFTDNIVTLLYKLYNSLQEADLSIIFRMSVRLLMLSYLSKSKEEQHEHQLQALQQITGKLLNWDCQKMNGVIMGAIKDPQYYSISSQQRLILICCLIPQLNHEYAYFEIVNEFNSQQKKRNQLLGDSLLVNYRYNIYSNLLKAE